MNEELYRNKLHIDSPTSISLGHITWFGLDTKMVGRIKALINENKDLKSSNVYLSETCDKYKMEIEKLKEEQQILYDANQYHQNIIHELETMKSPNQLYGENVNLRAENNKLWKRNKEIYGGFMATTEELCEATKETERLKSIIKEVREKLDNTTINCDGVADDLVDDIYEILDKENDNE